MVDQIKTDLKRSLRVCHQWHSIYFIITSVYEARKFVLFCNVEISQTKALPCRALGVFGKLSISRGASTCLVWDYLELWCGSYWLLNHFLNENHIKSKLKTWEFLESFQWVGVHQLGWLVWDYLELWCGRYWLLNHFVNENHKKSKLKTWGCSWCCCKALGKSDLIEFIPQFSELWCERECNFGMDFVAGNSNKLQKLGLEAKISVSPQCVHSWANGTGYTSVNENTIAILLNSSGRLGGAIRIPKTSKK
jgi:hypothetical protein